MVWIKSRYGIFINKKVERLVPWITRQSVMKLHAEPEPDTAGANAHMLETRKKAVIKPFSVSETIPAPVHGDQWNDNGIDHIFITQRALQGLRAAETGPHKRHAGTVHDRNQSPPLLILIPVIIPAINDRDHEGYIHSSETAGQ
nr:hypothetical protein [Pelodictyon luteolum]